MPSRFSQRWTVVTSRLRYAAISFHESSRSSGHEAVSRMAVYQRMVRPSSSPGSVRSRDEPAPKLYPCPAKGTAKDGIRRQVEE